MKIHIATPELVVLEAKEEEQRDEKTAQETVRAALDSNAIAQWDSIEIEDFTYRGQRLLFAKPVKVFVPSFLTRLLEQR
ncbi:MAG: hypothetical protein VB064_02550 [Oscillospiraceae bacterium]|nr:hypothetical protein [Oscillospiraceae bacterium]